MYVEIKPIQRNKIKQIHTNKRQYDHKLSEEDIKYIYNKCPTWKKYEQMVY